MTDQPVQPTEVNEASNSRAPDWAESLQQGLVRDARTDAKKFVDELDLQLAMGSDSGQGAKRVFEAAQQFQ